MRYVSLEEGRKEIRDVFTALQATPLMKCDERRRRCKLASISGVMSQMHEGKAGGDVGFARLEEWTG